MESPYLPSSSPEAPDPGLAGKQRFWKRMFWVGFLAFLLPSLSEMSGPIVRMGDEYQQLEAGSAEPGRLLNGIVMLSALYSFLFCLPGLIVLILSIIRLRACNSQAAKGLP
jgi:hypothetical protein